MLPKETKHMMKTAAGLLYPRIEAECIELESSHKCRDMCVFCLVLLFENKEHFQN